MKTTEPFALPRRPALFKAGADLGPSTFHLQAVQATDWRGAGRRVARMAGAHLWFPLSARENPSWRVWGSPDEARSWMLADAEALGDYPFWGR